MYSLHCCYYTYNHLVQLSQVFYSFSSRGFTFVVECIPCIAVTVHNHLVQLSQVFYFFSSGGFTFVVECIPCIAVTVHNHLVQLSQVFYSFSSGGFMLVVAPHETAQVIDFRETAPNAAKVDMFSGNAKLAQWVSSL